MKRYIRSFTDSSNFEHKAKELFNSLTEYGAKLITRLVGDNVYFISFYNNIEDSDPTLVHHCILYEGFYELTSHSGVTEYLDNETSSICVKLITEGNKISVEVSEELQSVESSEAINLHYRAYETYYDEEYDEYEESCIGDVNSLEEAIAIAEKFARDNSVETYVAEFNPDSGNKNTVWTSY